jgi:hypothetical protein
VQGEGRLSDRYFLRGIKWAFIALIVPEVVLISAAFQWCEAQILCTRLKELHSRPSDPVLSSSGEESYLDLVGRTVAPDQLVTPLTNNHANQQPSQANATERTVAPDQEVSPRTIHDNVGTVPNYLLNMRPLWLSTVGRLFNRPTKTAFPLEYGFYVGMGGFQAQVDDSRNSESFQVPARGRMAITPCGIIELGRAGVFLFVDLQTISHKSQVDVIAKALAMIQVTWMVIEASTIISFSSFEDDTYFRPSLARPAVCHCRS